jgi:Domain of unknown function (DUF3850)
MVKHELKVWPEYFEALVEGRKTFELRKDDRGFAVGDVLDLREWKPETEQYTGWSETFDVTYILRDTEHLAPGYVAMGIRAYVTLGPAGIARYRLQNRLRDAGETNTDAKARVEEALGLPPGARQKDAEEDADADN